MTRTRAIISKSDFNFMYAAMHKLHPRFGLMWAMGIETGLRISDLLSLKVSQISHFGNLDIRESKTGNWRSFKFEPYLLDELNTVVSSYNLIPDHYIFFSHVNRKKKHISRQYAHRLIARISKIRGLEHIGAHSMRKTYACRLFRSTGSLEAVQAILGHKHISTTLIYLRDLLSEIPTIGCD